MSSVKEHAAIGAKIKAMESDFLSHDDYRNLIKEKSITGCARYLKNNTTYKNVLGDTNISDIRRGALENLIKQNIVRNLDKIMHYYSGENREFIRTFYAKYEIEDLKDLAREAYNQEKIETPEAKVFIGKYSNAKPEKIVDSHSVGEIIQALSGTEFDKFTRPLLDNNRGENLFRFEMTLDLAYYNILQQKWEKLSPADRKTAEFTFGIIGDILNLQWIYRGKKFYNIEPELLLNYTIKLYHKLSFNKLKELCYKNNVADLINMANETDYGFLFKKDESTDIYMDRRMYRYLYFKLLAIDRKTTMNIINTIVYILLLEFEVRDIISIIEIVRYRVEENRGKQYLIKDMG